MVEECQEGGFQARALGHNVYTESETCGQLKKMVKDAVECHFDAVNRPRVIRLN